MTTRIDSHGRITPFVIRVLRRSRREFMPVIVLTTQRPHAKKKHCRGAGAKARIAALFNPPRSLVAVGGFIMPRGTT